MPKEVKLSDGALRLKEILTAEDLERFLYVVSHGFFTDRDQMGYESSQVHEALKDLAEKKPDAGYSEAVQGMVIQALGDIPNLRPHLDYGQKHPKYRSDRQQTTNLLYLAALLDRSPDLYEALFSHSRS